MIQRTFLLASSALTIATTGFTAPKREIKKALKWGMIRDPKAKSLLDNSD